MAITQGMGASVQRVEDKRYLQGHTSFIDSLMMPNMQTVAFVRSPYAHAHLLGVDVEGAREVEGVSYVLTAEEANGLSKPILAAREKMEPFFYYYPTDYPVMAHKKIRFVGEILAAVVADDRYIAEDAVELVYPDVETLDAVVDIQSALNDKTNLVHDVLGHNKHYFSQRESGDVDGAFASAYKVVSTELKTNRHCAAPMETRAVLANYDAAEDQLTVYTSSQMPHLVRTKLAELLNYPERKIRVIAPDVGGGFGLKCHIFPEELIVAALALKLKRPIKWIEDRGENFIAGFHAKDEEVKMSMAFNEMGQITGMQASFHADGGAYTSFPFTPMAEPSMAAAACAGPYKVPALRTESLAVYTNKATLSVCRGVGLPIVSYALEHTLDKAANELGLDPVDIRKRNLICREDFPFRSITGASFDSGCPIESLDQASDLIDYKAFRKEQAEAAVEGRYLGLGIASMVETTTYGKDIMAPTGKSENVALYDSAQIRVEPDGGITLSVGTHSHGQAHATTFSQLVVSELGCRLEDIRFVQGDTSQTPYGSGTWGSRSAVAGGGAVLKAARVIKDKALKVAAHLLEVSEDDIVLTDNGTYSRVGAPGVEVTLAEIAKAAVYESNLPAGLESGLEAIESNTPRSPYTIATHIAVVELEADTGTVHLKRYAVSEDCGQMINPMVVEGQIMGGVVQGMGSVMFEHHVYDEYGQLLTATMADYLMPTAPEVPNIEIAHMQSPSPITEGGIKGMGEGGAIAPMGSIPNAVADALKQADKWQEISVLPITPQRIFELLHKPVEEAS